MTDQEMLKVIADMGPEASGAFESWMNLQWAEFYTDTAFCSVLVLTVIVGIPMLFRWMAKINF